MKEKFNSIQTTLGNVRRTQNQRPPGRIPNHRYRVKRSEVKFLPRKIGDRPLSVSNQDWKRFDTVEQSSTAEGGVANSVSISRGSGFTGSECSDSISGSLNFEEDDENSSRIRESLKRELKLIQVAKADLKVKRNKSKKTLRSQKSQ